MTDIQRLNAARVPAFRNQATKATQRVSNSTKLTGNEDPGSQIPVVVWRANMVTNPYGLNPPVIMASAERVLRWDGRTPNQLFVDGFQPRAGFDILDVCDTSIHDEQFNLNRFVRYYYVAPWAKNFVFVSTARFIREHPTDPVATIVWTPTNFEPNGIWCYEIFAHGGVEVNQSLGHHQWEDQHEITFPGGIRPEFVRSARHYDHTGKMTCLHENRGTFNPAANPEGLRPDVKDLPEIIGLKVLEGMGKKVQVHPLTAVCPDCGLGPVPQMAVPEGARFAGGESSQPFVFEPEPELEVMREAGGRRLDDGLHHMVTEAAVVSASGPSGSTEADSPTEPMRLVGAAARDPGVDAGQQPRKNVCGWCIIS